MLALVTKRDLTKKLDLCKQRSEDYIRQHDSLQTISTFGTNSWQDLLLRRQIQIVRPLNQKVHVPSQIFPVDMDSGRGILPVGMTAIWSEGAEGVGVLDHTSGCHWLSSEGSVLLMD